MSFVLFSIAYTLFYLFLLISLGIVLPWIILRTVWRITKIFIKDFFLPINNKSLPKRRETRNKYPYNKTSLKR